MGVSGRKLKKASGDSSRSTGCVLPSREALAPQLRPGRSKRPGLFLCSR